MLHEAVRSLFSICKHILRTFWSWKRPFSKHTEAEQKIHHAYKKRVYVQIVSKDSFTFWSKVEFSWQKITGLQLFTMKLVTMKIRYLNLRIVDIVTNVNKKRMLFGHLQEVNRGQSWTKNAKFGYILWSKKSNFNMAIAELWWLPVPKIQLNLTLFNWVIASKPPKMDPIEL